MGGRKCLLRVILVWVAFVSFAGDRFTYAQNEKQLVLYCWPGYVPEVVTQAFTNETGIEVLVEYYSTNEELLRHRLTGRRYDLVQPSDYAADALIKRKALQPLRHDKIPNLKNLDEKFRKLPHDPEDEFTIPWLSGTVGIVVNTNRINDPVQSYSDLFSGQYRGRIVALNDSREWLGWALCHLGLPVNHVTPEVLQQVETVWKEWMPQVGVFDSDNAADVMISGDADVALTWSGDAATLLAASTAYQFVLPEEGVHRYVDCLAIPRGAPHRESAEKFMNFILRPDVSLMISKTIPFTNPNREAFTKLTETERSNPASYPKGDLALKSFRDIGDMTEQVEKLYNDLRFRPVAD